MWGNVASTSPLVNGRPMPPSPDPPWQLEHEP